MKMKAVKEKFFYLLAIGISIFLLFFVITCTWIGYDVKRQCKDAQRDYAYTQTSEMNCVDALIMQLQDEGKGYRIRNSSIWALGQLGNPRALPVLESYYTGVIPAREPLNQMISQYELKKAIALTSGGYNMTAMFWRYGGIEK